MEKFLFLVKKYLWIVAAPVAIITLLSISSLKDIEQAYARFKLGRDITLYLRKSTDMLTYLSIAYTSTSEKKFIDQFNNHLEERKKYFDEIFSNKIITVEEFRMFERGLQISDELATKIEKIAFDKMDSKAFFTPEYLEYKRRIYENDQNFRTLINDSSEKLIKEETKLLNIYLYSLCFIILSLVYLIKHEDKPVAKIKNKTKKRK